MDEYAAVMEPLLMASTELFRPWERFSSLLADPAEYWKFDSAALHPTHACRLTISTGAALNFRAERHTVVTIATSLSALDQMRGAVASGSQRSFTSTALFSLGILQENLLTLTRQLFTYSAHSLLEKERLSVSLASTLAELLDLWLDNRHAAPGDVQRVQGAQMRTALSTAKRLQGASAL